MKEFLPYLITGPSAFAGCYLANHILRRAAARRGFLDMPSGRKMHKRPVPYGGGAGMYIAAAAALAALYLFWGPAFLYRTEITAIVCGGAVIVLFGLYDDILGSGAVQKLTAEAAAALIMYHAGFRIERISAPWAGSISLGGWGLAATIFWYWIMMNAINLIDGLDGLAAGVAGISALTILAMSAGSGRPLAICIALITAGVCLGFLPHNFPPARQFMGDAGSLFLGFLLGSLTLLTSTKAPALLTLLIPLVAVGMPVFDAGHAFFRRIIRGAHPFRADTQHFHHRLVGLGLSQKRAVLVMYYISAYLGVMAYVLSQAPPELTVVVVILLGAGMFLAAENLTVLGKALQDRNEGRSHDK